MYPLKRTCVFTKNMHVTINSFYNFLLSIYIILQSILYPYNLHYGFHNLHTIPAHIHSCSCNCVLIPICLYLYHNIVILITHQSYFYTIILLYFISYKILFMRIKHISIPIYCYILFLQFQYLKPLTPIFIPTCCYINIP